MTETAKDADLPSADLCHCSSVGKFSEEVAREKIGHLRVSVPFHLGRLLHLYSVLFKKKKEIASFRHK